MTRTAKRTMVALVLGGLIASLAPPVASAAAVPSIFGAFRTYDVPSYPMSVVVGDFTGDGRQDAVVSTGDLYDPPNDFKLFLFAQTPSGTFGVPTRIETGGTGIHPGTFYQDMALSAGDLDGAGGDDIALATRSGVDVFLQDGAGLAPRRLVALPETRQVEIADLDGDGVRDLVANTASGVAVLVGLGAGTYATPTFIVDEQQDEIEVGDVTGDGRLDVVGFTWRIDPVAVHVFRQLEGDGFAPAVDTRGVTGDFRAGGGLGVGDVTGDGRADVALSIVGNSPGSLINVFAQGSDGTLEDPVVLPSYDMPEPVEIADIDLDGRSDIVTVHGGWYAVGAYLQKPDGTLAPERLFGVPYATHYLWKAMDIGDVTGDGRPDVVLADTNQGLVVLPSTTATDPVDPPPPGGSEGSGGGPAGPVRDITEYACPAAEVPDPGFVDVTGDVFRTDIECLAWYAITEGGPNGLPLEQYGPSLEVTRAQMATFIVRAIDHAAPGRLAPPGATSDFEDIAGIVHASSIDRLARAGLVLGGPGGMAPEHFGPDLPVSRAQMATFIGRAYDLIGATPLEAGGDRFGDDDASTHQASINALAGAGIVQGRSPDVYAPGDNVGRGAMAAFLMRMMDLLVEEGRGSPPA